MPGPSANLLNMTIPFTYTSDKPNTVKIRNDRTAKLVAQVVWLRDVEHLQWHKIAEDVGLGSKQRAFQLYHHAKSMPTKDHPLYGLSTRARNCLRQMRLQNKTEIKQAMEDGKLDPYTNRTRNYGFATFVEIKQWLMR
jgi:hypothetical protein